MSEHIGNTKNHYDLSLIDTDTLTPIVRQVSNYDSIIITDWKYERVHGGAAEYEENISSVFKFSGQALDRNSPINWSVILKVVGTTSSDIDPNHPRYWQREVLAYQSGQLGNLPGQLITPRFFGYYSFSESIIGMWFEYIEDDLGSNWLLEQYRTVAEHLGRFNGTFLVDRELPSWNWLSREWLRKQVEGGFPAFIIGELRKSLDVQSAQAWFIDDDANRILALWNKRDLYLDALDQLPQTFIHHDAFRRNIFIKHDENRNTQIVAIDWAFAGIGAVGEELVALVNAPLFFGETDLANVKDIDRVVFEAYINGLSDAGWHGDSRLARLGYTAGSAMLWGLAYHWFDPPPEFIPETEQMYNRPIDEIRVLKRDSIHYALELADEAQSLMAIL